MTSPWGLHSDMGRHGIVLVNVKLNFTIYMPYHPCCVQKLWSMLCLPMVGACAETASSHGQTRDNTYACKLNLTIYMAYDLRYHQCCVHKLWSILCLPVAGACAETASSHGQTQHSTCTCKSSFTIYMVYDRWYHPCCVPGVGQYCACRCLMQKLYSAMGRHLYHLCCIR